MKAVLPSRSIALLMLIGFLDLAMTAYLYSRGQIAEMNPLMRVLLERSEWLFAAVKAATLIVAWWLLARYGQMNPRFVRFACLGGATIYVTIWTVWFVSGL